MPTVELYQAERKAAEERRQKEREKERRVFPTEEFA